MNEIEKQIKDLLTKALVQNDKNAQAELQQVIKAAKAQNDQKSKNLIAMIQKFAQQIQQGQDITTPQVAKDGAKLAYIMSLKNKCPEGYTKTLKKGGCMCKKKKAAEGDKIEFTRSDKQRFIKKS